MVLPSTTSNIPRGLAYTEKLSASSIIVLEQLAKSSGYRGWTAATSNEHTASCYMYGRPSIVKCYRLISHNDQLNLLEAAKYILSSAIEQSQSPVQVMKRIEQLIDDTSLHVNVANFADQRAKNDDTWMFWK